MQLADGMWPRFLRTVRRPRSMRRPACVHCGEYIFGMPQPVADGKYLCPECFKVFFFENGDPREPDGPEPERWTHHQHTRFP